MPREKPKKKTLHKIIGPQKKVSVALLNSCVIFNNSVDIVLIYLL